MEKTGPAVHSTSVPFFFNLVLRASGSTSLPPLISLSFAASTNAFVSNSHQLQYVFTASAVLPERYITRTPYKSTGKSSQNWI
jgi:hypothetical protein